jgi:excisionase family DNA binding protein
MDVNATGENHAMAEGKLLLRPTEAASALGVSRARLYQLLASGEINSVKIGASRRVPAVDLSNYVDRLRAESGKTAPTALPSAVA